MAIDESTLDPKDVVYSKLEPVEPAKPSALTPADLLRLGALTLDQERSQAVEEQLADQKAFYQEASREELIAALLERDRHLMHTGRQAADGRMTGRLLRELLRGLLATADMQALRQVGQYAKGGQIEKILGMLGAEPADLRDLKLSGTTLGRLEDPEQRAEDLVSGKLKK
jgi:hypothetical protein